MIFDTLKTNRVHNKREFFRGDLKEIIEVIEDTVKQINDNYANIPERAPPAKVSLLGSQNLE